MTIYLIRHGKTAANEQHLYCGSTDLPLSPAGLEALKELSYETGECCFVTSGMKRTEQTLAALFGDVPHRIEPDFREIDFGAFEMKSYAELKDDPNYQAWLTGDNQANTPPGGESGNAMTERALAAFRKLNQNTVVITHGGVIAAIMEALFPHEGKNRYQWQPKPGHGYKITGNTYVAIP